MKSPQMCTGKFCKEVFFGSIWIIQHTNAVVRSSNRIRLKVLWILSNRPTFVFLCNIRVAHYPQVFCQFFPNCNFLGLNAGGTETGGVPVPYK